MSYKEAYRQSLIGSKQLVKCDEFVVAFRTHVWSPEIKDLAVHIHKMAAGARFVILADFTKGILPIEQFEIISNTDDFSAFGLPSFPPQQVLWYNADYPLYTLAEKFPAASHFAMIEYDVRVNVPIHPILSIASEENIDLVAHYIHEADGDWEWAPLIKRHFQRPFQAFLPFMIISARAVRYLLRKRREGSQRSLKEFEDWPFCEAFIPSALHEAGSFRWEELGIFANLKHYTFDSILHPSHPWAFQPGSIVHKVRVTSNLALGKPATQSSVHPWWQAESEEIDAARGNNGRRGRAEGFNTAAEQDPWWQVDLLFQSDVSSVIIYDRIDAPSAGIRLAISTSVDQRSWVVQAEPTLCEKLILKFARPIKMRYLRIIRLGFGELHLDEIEIY
jgi:hypothetical protein